MRSSPRLRNRRGHLLLFNVLLVEDNEANRDMLSRRLSRQGWDVILAAEGRQAITMAADLCPDVILMDMELPGLSGWDATRILKSSPLGRQIPVIGLSGHCLPDDREQALKAGCDDFESKPVSFDRLLFKMHQVVGERLTNNRAHDERLDHVGS